ncbi:MAG: gliding motility-associated C-terminal domain-containing protein [Chitinophagales bacterium]
MIIEQIFKVRTFVLLLLVLLTANTIEAQPNPPQIDCVSFSNSVSSIQWIYQSGADCNGAGSFENYVIYRSENPTGPFVELDAIPSPPPYEDETNDVVFYYYMTIRCGGQESLPSDTVRNRRPAPPEIVKTTVLNDGSVEIAFLPSPDSDVSGYFLVKSEDGGSFSPIDDVPPFTNVNDTLYIIDASVDARIASIGYKLSAFSCSLSTNPGDLSDAHYTVFVSAEVDECNDLVALSWTPYIGWNQVVDGVLVDSVTTYTVYTEVDTTIVDAPTTNLNYSILPTTANRCFSIVANNTTGISSESNEACISRAASNPPTDICLDYLTVDTLSNAIDIRWNIDETSDITFLEIHRGTNADNIQNLGRLPDDSPSFSRTLDNLIDINEGPYFYQIVHVDECNRRVESSVGNTMFLRARNQLDATNLLEWNAFSMGENSTINGYTIYRTEDGIFKNFAAVENLNEDTFRFVDEVDNREVTYCYYIEADYTVTCNDGTTTSERSQSNEVCVSQSPRMFVPNAFAPNGVNSIFKPILRNPNPNDYQMVVFNRWGEHIFQTNDPEDGWDGFHNGKLARQGAYAYFIRMTTELGFVLERKGTVILVR